MKANKGKAALLVGEKWESERDIAAKTIVPEVADIINISENKRAEFCEQLVNILHGTSITWALSNVAKKGDEVFKKKGYRTLLEAEKKVRTANHAVAKLHPAMTLVLDLMIGRTLWKWKQMGISRRQDRDIRHQKNGDLDLDMFAKHWRYALPIMAYVLSELTGKSPFSNAPGHKGRPRGTYGDWPLRSLIHTLYSLADDCGGQLTFDRKKDGAQAMRGNSLGRALHLLRPALPPGLIPQTLPYSTIEDIVAEYHARRRGLRR